MSSNKRREAHIRKFFEDKAKGLDHQKLQKRASELRRAEKKRSGASRRRVRRDDWEDLVEGDATTFDQLATQRDSTSTWVKRLEAAETSIPINDASAAGLAEGTVSFVTSGACRVATSDGEVDCDLADELRLVQRTALAVGDDVLFDKEVLRVRHVLPRRTWLSRPDPTSPSVERVIAANVDLVLIVAALRDPVLSVGLVERVALAVGRGGATPVVCANKVDLAADRKAELAPLVPLEAAGMEVLPCSATTGEGVEALQARMRGRTSVLVGHSGVGKSSLLNAVAPELALVTGTVRDADGKGRHTTTSSSLFALADGTRLIDTPGVRQFGMWRMTPTGLAEAFPDLAEHAGACRYRDCTHDHEPRCGVRDAAEQGRLAPARYASYLRILATI